ncbi:MAG: N-6 DNA methylase [bacterium]
MIATNWEHRLRQKIITNAIGDPIFYDGLDQAANEIKNEAKKSINEATIAGIFERVLYHTLRSIGLYFHPEKETTVETERHVRKGRTDARLGALVIEYKHFSKLQNEETIEEAIQQLENYIKSISEQDDTETIGFLTDGFNCYEIRSISGEIVALSGRTELNKDVLLRITRSILSLDQYALNARNLVRDFCGKQFSGVLFDVARTLKNVLVSSPTPKTKMLFSEWEAMFRLAHEDQSQQRRIEERRRVLGEIFKITISTPEEEYISLFALHTAYAIILKLISYRVVSDVQFGAVLQNYKDLLSAENDNIQAFCNRLEDGDLFRQVGILNLLEGDFFSWYADPNQWSADLASSVKEILTILGKYEDVNSIFESRSVVDLFRSLYEASVPQVIRASFGEFYTPYWLANHVLESSRLEPNWTALDPCCGSGTFIIAAIAKIREELKNQDKLSVLNAILKRVAAIDLNPLAVLTTRIHYFIHIVDLLPKEMSDLVIPVYLGDASCVPELVKEEGEQFFEYQLPTVIGVISFRLPLILSQNTPRFLKIMHEYEQAIYDQEENYANELLINNLPAERRSEAVIRNIESLTSVLIDLERKEWNGIWARIISNFLTVASLKRFTNIVGNPPWIDWKNLPEGYRQKVKVLCIDKGLFSGAGRTGGINLNICALIAHVSITSWLEENGHLAFLMPRELAYQASYEGWRHSIGGENCHISEFHDWSLVGHPFDPVKEDFMTYVLTYTSGDQRIIKTPVYIKKTKKANASSWKSQIEAFNHIEVKTTYAGQIRDGSSSYTFSDSVKRLQELSKIGGNCEYIGREGIEFYPQEIMLFYYDSPGPKEGTVFVRNVQMKKSKYRVAEERILLESKYLYPLVKGPNIECFNYNDPGFIVPFPYENEDPHRPITRKELRKRTGSPLLLKYFEKYEKLIKGQTDYSDSIRADGEFYGVARTGPYSFHNTYVAYRDNTKWRATVVTGKEMPWGEYKRYLFQNHAVSMCEVSDRSRFIDEEEAHYICGILNTPIVEEFVLSSSDSRSFKIRPPVYLPEFNKDEEKHLRIAKLSKKAHMGLEDIDSVRIAIEKLYLLMCQENPNALQLPGQSAKI